MDLSDVDVVIDCELIRVVLLVSPGLDRLTQIRILETRLAAVKYTVNHW